MKYGLEIKLKKREQKKLKNKVLGCWCKPDKCYGDIFIDVLCG